jgi:hypothetical protein
MEIRKARRQMVRRPEFGAPLVTGLAAIRSLDFGVAHQAIGHLRQVRLGHLAGFGHASMAGAACIAAIAAQMPPDIPGRLQVPFVVDGCRENARHVAHFQMQGVVEMSHPGGRWTRDDGILVTLVAELFGGKKVVRGPGAGERRTVARGAIQFELKMQTMRKRRG